MTEKDVSNAIGKWLVNSRDREGYRTARQATNSNGGGSGGAATSNGGGSGGAATSNGGGSGGAAISNGGGGDNSVERDIDADEGSAVV